MHIIERVVIVCHVQDDYTGSDDVRVSLDGQEIGRVALADAVRQLKLVPQSRYDDAAEFFG